MKTELHNAVKLLEISLFMCDVSNEASSQAKTFLEMFLLGSLEDRSLVSFKSAFIITLPILLPQFTFGMLGCYEPTTLRRRKRARVRKRTYINNKSVI